MSVISWHFGLLRKKKKKRSNQIRFEFQIVRHENDNNKLPQAANCQPFSFIGHVDAGILEFHCTMHAVCEFMDFNLKSLSCWTLMCSSCGAANYNLCDFSLPGPASFQLGLPAAMSQSVLCPVLLTPHFSLLTWQVRSPVSKRWCYPTLLPSPSRGSRLDDCLLRAHKLRELAQKSNALNHSGHQDVTIHLLGMEARVGRHIDSGL